MKANTDPSAIPSDLLGEMRHASEELGLSMADIMRQSMKVGLPKLREQLSPNPLKGLLPLSRDEARICYGESNSEFDALEHHLAGLPLPPPEVE